MRLPKNAKSALRTVARLLFLGTCLCRYNMIDQTCRETIGTEVASEPRQADFQHVQSLTNVMGFPMFGDRLPFFSFSHADLTGVMAVC